jgi:CBS domain-containing protein
MRVEELMHSTVVTCQSNETLEQAAKQLWDHDCGLIAVVNDQGTLVGMLTDRDICMGALMTARPLSEIPIHTAMSRAVYAVTRDVSVKEVEGLMSEQQVRRVPVVDADRKPIGMVTINDLVREAAKPGGRISIARVLQTLAAIGQHRTAVVQAA